jgi:hypothetical protein
MLRFPPQNIGKLHFDKMNRYYSNCRQPGNAEHRRRHLAQDPRARPFLPAKTGIPIGRRGSGGTDRDGEGERDAARGNGKELGDVPPLSRQLSWATSPSLSPHAGNISSPLPLEIDRND